MELICFFYGSEELAVAGHGKHSNMLGKCNRYHKIKSHN